MRVEKAVEKGLSRRERQIMDVIYRRGQATAAEVLEDMPDPPSYSAVRAMLRVLEEKGHLRHEQQGPRYVFLPTVPREQARRSALEAARADVLRRLDRADGRRAARPVGPQALGRRARPALPADRPGPEGGTLIMKPRSPRPAGPIAARGPRGRRRGQGDAGPRRGRRRRASPCAGRRPRRGTSPGASASAPRWRCPSCPSPCPAGPGASCRPPGIVADPARIVRGRSPAPRPARRARHRRSARRDRLGRGATSTRTAPRIAVPTDRDARSRRRPLRRGASSPRRGRGCGRPGWPGPWPSCRPRWPDGSRCDD